MSGRCATAAASTATGDVMVMVSAGTDAARAPVRRWIAMRRVATPHGTPL